MKDRKSELPNGIIEHLFSVATSDQQPVAGSRQPETGSLNPKLSSPVHRRHRMQQMISGRRHHRCGGHLKF
jgi:hypothetical protein